MEQVRAVISFDGSNDCQSLHWENSKRGDEMKTIVKLGFSFDELSEKAQENAVNKLSDINVDFDYWFDFDGLTAFSEEENKKYNLGGMYDDLLKYNKMYFDIDRAWYIQFVNASFRDEEQARRFLGFDKRAWAKVKNSYSIGTRSWIRDDTTRITFEDTDEEGNKWTAHVQAQIDRAIDRFSDKIEDCLRSLQKEYEYQTSEEAIIDTIKANGYTFDERGNLI